MTYEKVLEHIQATWPSLIRENKTDSGTLIGLPYPYVVPSAKTMFQEMYYWDSYFISVGLLGSGYEHHIVHMAENMAYLLKRFGVMPNASRFYFLSRSQPPFFTQQIRLAYSTLKVGNLIWLERMIAIAAREHETVWYGEAHPHFRRVFRGLSRYYDINVLDILASCESGWDHSTRCDERWLDHLPVDLNSILYVRELDLAWGYDQLGESEIARVWRGRAAERAETMQELMWDANDGFFFDYDYKNLRRTRSAPSLAGFYPLWAGLATQEQAAEIVERWLPNFEFPGGLVTTLESREGRQWAFPNGWAPLQWIVTEGLHRYGFIEDANRLRAKWCNICAAEFEQTGALWEKYNVVEPHQKTEEGLYGQVEGFGWTNSVVVDFARKLT
ncbi:MAG: alpha,alpha-trehalase [Anaerolineae bacterium]|nr:alpha,alpha-trehalase [Anaerolineae bacterium]